jgi:hypothetical protein
MLLTMGMNFIAVCFRWLAHVCVTFHEHYVTRILNWTTGRCCNRMCLMTANDCCWNQNEQSCQLRLISRIVMEFIITVAFGIFASCSGFCQLIVVCSAAWDIPVSLTDFTLYECDVQQLGWSLVKFNLLTYSRNPCLLLLTVTGEITYICSMDSCDVCQPCDQVVALVMTSQNGLYGNDIRNLFGMHRSLPSSRLWAILGQWLKETISVFCTNITIWF